MAMNASNLKEKMKQRIVNGLQKEFGASPETAVALNKLANALSDIAFDIVAEITTNARVDSGTPVATTPPMGSGPTSTGGVITTAAPAKII